MDGGRRHADRLFLGVGARPWSSARARTRRRASTFARRALVRSARLAGRGRRPLPGRAIRRQRRRADPGALLLRRAAARLRRLRTLRLARLAAPARARRKRRRPRARRSARTARGLRGPPREEQLT